MEAGELPGRKLQQTCQEPGEPSARMASFLHLNNHCPNLVTMILRASMALCCLQHPNTMHKRLFGHLVPVWLSSLLFQSFTSSLSRLLKQLPSVYSSVTSPVFSGLQPSCHCLIRYVSFLFPSPLPEPYFHFRTCLTHHFSFPAWCALYPPPSGRIHFLLICILMAPYIPLLITLCYGYVTYMSIKFWKGRTYLLSYPGTKPGTE